MSILLYALIQAYPAPPSRTTLSLTVPMYSVKCLLTDVTGAPVSFELLQAGGRGYEDLRSDAPGYKVQRTRIQLKVVGDNSKLLAGFTYDGHLSDEVARWSGARQLSNGIKTIQLETMPTRNPSRIAMIVEPDWPLGNVVATGFCDLNETKQQPLSAVETKKWLAQ